MQNSKVLDFWKEKCDSEILYCFVFLCFSSGHTWICWISLVSVLTEFLIIFWDPIIDLSVPNRFSFCFCFYFFSFVAKSLRENGANLIVENFEIQKLCFIFVFLWFLRVTASFSLLNSYLILFFFFLRYNYRYYSCCDFGKILDTCGSYHRDGTV